MLMLSHVVTLVMLSELPIPVILCSVVADVKIEALAEPWRGRNYSERGECASSLYCPEW